MEFDWSGQVFGMMEWVWDNGAAAEAVSNGIFPGGSTFTGTGPGNASFSRTGVGSASFSQTGPGNSTIVPKTQRN